MKKVVLAYSGGLDTSCAIRWLNLKGFDVVCFSANLGQDENFSLLEERALRAGAQKVYVKNLVQEFVSDFILPSLKANAIYEDKYPLATALGRPLIAKYLVEVAHKEKAEYISHGCTGKGNDQVRIEVAAGMLDPALKIIAPVREWEFKSREEGIEFAERYGIPIDVTRKKPYSIDRNIWGVSIEAGILEDPYAVPPEDVYQITMSPQKAPAAPRYLEVSFEKGVPVKIDGRRYKLPSLINELNRIGARHAIGRYDLVENRLIGIKSREIYEAPAATILLTAHKELEALVLDRELAHFKELVSLKYSELVYYGLWYSEFKKSLDAFIEVSQKRVSGTVTLMLFKGNCTAVARKSPHSLYKKELATYGKEDKFDQKMAEGFIKLWGLPYRRK